MGHTIHHVYKSTRSSPPIEKKIKKKRKRKIKGWNQIQDVKHYSESKSSAKEPSVIPLLRAQEWPFKIPSRIIILLLKLYPQTFKWRLSFLDMSQHSKKLCPKFRLLITRGWRALAIWNWNQNMSPSCYRIDRIHTRGCGIRRWIQTM